MSRPLTVPDLGIVLGTFNRLAMLRDCVESVRRTVGTLTYELIVVDGGSIDGSREWLARQPDVVLIGQRGPLTGAVRAYDLGFSYAVDVSYANVGYVNDDDQVLGPEPTLQYAVELLQSAPDVGAVALELDLRSDPPGQFTVETWGGAIYANKGVVRREAGMAAARAQGDPSGRLWWNPEFHTYCADTELGLWLWRLGYRVLRGNGLRVHDRRNERAELTPLDELQRRNEELFHKHGGGEGFSGGEVFCRRWSGPETWAYHRVDAERFGGILR